MTSINPSKEIETLSIEDVQSKIESQNFQIREQVLRDLENSFNFDHQNISEMALLLMNALAMEKSEECLSLLLSVINKYLEEIIKSLEPTTKRKGIDDLSDNLAQLLHHSCPNVLDQALTLLTNMANLDEKHKNKLFDWPILTSRTTRRVTALTTHKHQQIRCLALSSLASLILINDNDYFRTNAPHLAQRIFDHNAKVRRSVNVTVARLMLEWKHRHDNCVFLVPLILSGLVDEVSAVQLNCEDLWRRVGQAWLNESISRDERLKDRRDFEEEPQSISTNYPKYIRNRPTLGCRILVHRCFLCLNEALRRDLSDWRQETRVKSIQLITLFLVHLEQETMKHADIILDLLKVAAMDKEIRHETAVACRLYGQFVAPRVWTELIIDRQQSTTKKREIELGLVSDIVDGSEAALLEPHADDLIELICGVVDRQESECLASCLACLSALCRRLSRSWCKNNEQRIFSAVIKVLAFAEDDVGHQAEDLLKRLPGFLGQRSTNMIESNLESMLKQLREQNVELWHEQSSEMLIFITIVRITISDSRFTPNKAILPSFLNIIERRVGEKGRPEVAVRLLINLARIVNHFKSDISPHVHNIIQNCLLPNLIWRSGRKACACRQAAAACLFSLLSTEACLIQLKIMPNLGNLIKVTTDLTQDEEVGIRVIGIHCLALISEILVEDEVVNEENLRKCTEAMLDCVDDEEDSVRMLALRSARATIDQLDNFSSVKARLEHLDELFKKQ